MHREDGASVEEAEGSAQRQPIGDVLGGLEIHPIEDGSTDLELFALIKARSRSGEIVWSMRTSSAPNRYELIGALRVQLNILEADLLEDWVIDDDEG
jgi:hypothetical protein